MWQHLALAAGKSILDNQANKQNLASQVITQKYSPWTGQRADFSGQGQNSFGSNMLAGIGGAMLDAKADAAKEAEAVAKKTAQDKADGDYYASNSDLMRGERGNTIAPAKSSFAAIAPSRSPATTAAPSQSSFADMFPVHTQGQTPLMLQGQNPQGQDNMWLKMLQGGGMR